MIYITISAIKKLVSMKQANKAFTMEDMYRWVLEDLKEGKTQKPYMELGNILSYLSLFHTLTDEQAIQYLDDFEKTLESLKKKSRSELIEIVEKTVKIQS